MTDPIPDEPVCGWTIYDHPADYPHHYAVRQWFVTEGGGIVQKAVAVLCLTLEEARAQVPLGAHCFPREETDDPVIIETYI
jgi:hypothetical protein